MIAKPAQNASNQANFMRIFRRFQQQQQSILIDSPFRIITKKFDSLIEPRG